MNTNMNIWMKRLLILAGLGAAAWVLGRVSIRGVLNALVGGTITGGNPLW